MYRSISQDSCWGFRVVKLHPAMVIIRVGNSNTAEKQTSLYHDRAYRKQEKEE